MTDLASKARETCPKAKQPGLAGQYADQNAGRFYLEPSYFGSNSIGVTK